MVVSAALFAGCGSAQSGADRGPVDEDAGQGKDGGSAGSGGSNTDGGGSDAGVDSSVGITTCAVTMCNDKASCDDSTGQAKCRCNAGYVGDGTTCDDIDECAHPTVSKCDANATCKNTPGGFKCACKAGFLGDGTTCTDVDECTDGLLACPVDAKCKNSEGGAKCVCKAGYHEDNGDCVDDDECAVGAANPLSCGANSTCMNTPGSAFCECDAGFHDDGSGACVANASCGGGCDTNATCMTSVCVCNDGYEGDGSVGNCTNVDECTDNKDNCSSAATCADMTPGFTCTCKSGFKDNSTGDPGTICDDIDECMKGTDNCDSVAMCNNTTGSFTCTCPAGYSDVNGDGTVCLPINECNDSNLNNCSPNAACTDKTPGFTCACKPGFKDNNPGTPGTNCTDIDECANSTLNDCAGGETCTNDIGGDPGYHCGCNPPFVKTGNSCYCDLTGMWGMRQNVTTTWPSVNGLLAAGTYNTTVWELHRMVYDGTTIKVDKKGCGPAGTPDVLGIGAISGETYGTYIPTSVWNAFGLFTGVDVPLAAAVPGDDFITPKEAVVLGITLANPLTDNWPTLANAVKTDPDGDGVDGLMVWPRTPSTETHASTSGSKKYYSYPYVSLTNRSTCVTSATRVINHLDGKLDACDKISGSIVRDKAPGQTTPAVQTHVYACKHVGAVSADASKDWGCTKANWDAQADCTTAERNQLDGLTDNQTVTATFEMVKLSGDPNDATVTCATVKSMLPAYP